MQHKIAERLHEYYRSGHYTYDTLANKAGVSKTTLHTYMTHPPATPRPDTVRRIVEAMGHTMEELYADIPLPTTEEEFEIEIATEENKHLKEELTQERGLQVTLANEIKHTREVFEAESKKNDELLKLYRKQLDSMSVKCDKEHLKNVVLWVMLFVVSGLMIIFFMYSFYAFFAFDVKDLTRGLWPFPWMG